MSSDALSAVTAPRLGRTLPAVLAACRPLQWSKNLLVFAGILFSANLDDGARWVAAITCFVAYCAASSASYLANDVHDRVVDAQHPIKRRRPVAAGAVAPRTALIVAGVLLLVAVALTSTLGAESLLLLAAFLAVQGAYTLALRDVVGLDVAAIATLFVIRAAAGAAAVDVPISAWLLLCTALLAAFLALGKRRAELVTANGETRSVLRRYSQRSLDWMLAIVAVATIAVYTTYTLVAGESRLLVATVPLVVFGIGRYGLLLHRREAGEEPDRVLFADRYILGTICAWAAVCAVVLMTR